MRRWPRIPRGADKVHPLILLIIFLFPWVPCLLAVTRVITLPLVQGIKIALASYLGLLPIIGVFLYHFAFQSDTLVFHFFSINHPYTSILYWYGLIISIIFTFLMILWILASFVEHQKSYEEW